MVVPIKYSFLIILKFSDFEKLNIKFYIVLDWEFKNLNFLENGSL